ncbi:MAG: DUF255 domain-containing protein, partial [Verrucomicrobiota bacterium]
MSNRLAEESSLYLRQHAENPVDWLPYGEEAFTKAEEEDRPLLISIGYSSCHWCHVMAHECFESDYIARLMNKHFVCVKVDREERPDVDRVYMEAAQMINQHGGWPLNVFCLPDGRPFYGGTYFPPKDLGQGLIPWPQLLMRISDYFQNRRSELEENAGNIVSNLEHMSDAVIKDGKDWSPRTLLDAVRRIVESLDQENGGFGGAPKFPPSMVLQFLMAMRQTRALGNEFPQLADQVDHAVQLTLERMARGGLFDQVGGGFCRYCVDVEWVIPHFEKMLYDNALLIEVFAEGWARYREPLFERVVAETVEWLEREMRLESGLYAASVDADSPEGEGRFYCWTPTQLKEVLGEEEAGRFSQCYRVTEAGNFEDQLSYPQCDGSIEERDALKDARDRLWTVRSKRPAPGRDDKELTFWNALTARALFRAGFVFNRPEWIQRAAEIDRRIAATGGEAWSMAKPPVDIIEQATVPIKAVAPRGIQSVGVGIFLGLAMGVFFALVGEMRADTRRVTHQLQAQGVGRGPDSAANAAQKSPMLLRSDDMDEALAEQAPPMLGMVPEVPSG